MPLYLKGVWAAFSWGNVLVDKAGCTPIKVTSQSTLKARRRKLVEIQLTFAFELLKFSFF
jgi:hypothetical protein